MRTELSKSAVFYALVAVAAMSLAVMLGDENPSRPLPLGVFVGVKLAAVAVMLLCERIGRRLYRRGLLPKHITNSMSYSDDRM